MIALRWAPVRTLALEAPALLILAVAIAFVLDQLQIPSVTSSPVQRTFDRRPMGERALADASDSLARSPGDPVAMARLGSAYLLRVRETGDPTYYARADRVLAPALAAAPDQLEVVAAAGSLALSRHQFFEALGLGQRAVAIAPDRPVGFGILTDALVELGRYDEAVIAAQRMVDLRPDQAALSRVSYLRELHGDLPGAIDAMQRAVLAGAPEAETTAWSEVHLGHLLFAKGDIAPATRAYESATHRIDGYIFGVAGLARVNAVRGDLNSAVALYEQASLQMPLPEIVIALGDAYAAAGETAKAQEQYALVGAMQRLLAANGVRTDVDLALFNADHGLDPSGALEAARAEYALRKSVQVVDTLAWVEYRAGELAAAQGHSREALRLGTRDPLMLYHAGVIAQESGDLAGARDLLGAVNDLNPGFSLLWAADLQSRLAQLSQTEGAIGKERAQ